MRILTPLQYPGKVLCAGANYYDHLAEMGVKDLRKEAQRLFFFFKPPRNALVGPGRTVRYPARSQMFDWEIELAAVIGRTAKDLSPDDALGCVAGYSVGIDLSARDLNQAPETFYKFDWVAGKAQDTCCPLGPRIVPAALVGDAQNLALELKVNGETKQNARTSGMIFDIREQLVLLSSIMTLDPGDVLLTGTPAGVGFPQRTFCSGAIASPRRSRTSARSKSRSSNPRESKMKPLHWLALAAALVSATAGAQQKTVLRFSTAAPPPDFLTRSIQQFKTELEAAAPEFDVQVYPGSQLFRQGTEVPALQRGNLEMSTMTTFEVAQQIPEFGFFNRAYLFRDYDQAYRTFTGAVGKRYIDTVAARWAW